MASLKQMIRDAERAAAEAERTGKAALNPVVAPQHAAWITRPEAEQAFTPAAIERGDDILYGRHQMKRSERFSASGLGKCERRQVFHFLGHPQAPLTPQLADIMRSGTAAHFWIMLEGLSAGWLIEAEVFYKNDDYRMGGTLDGIISDASIWEYKSTSMNIYRDVTTDPDTVFSVGDRQIGPKYDHLLQLQAYELLTGMELKSLFYQHRDYGSYQEFRLGPNEVITAKLIALLERLNAHLDDNTLPPMLEPCTTGHGQTFKDCPFRHSCSAATRPYV